MTTHTTDSLVTRRRALGVVGGSVAALTTGARLRAEPEADEVRRTGMGLVVYCQRYRREQLRKEEPSADLFEPLRFLGHCRSLGAGGMQASLGGLDSRGAGRLRERAAEWGMYVEAIVGLPAEDGEVDRFEAELRTAREAGALAARTTIIPGRRYERFTTFEEYRRYSERGRRMLERAAPIAEKVRVPIAVENHKDHRIDERLALFEHIGSEYVGACVDTGNSFALLEDAHETVAALAPWAHSVHIKDQGVAEYEDGFLLADVPLGKGIFDLSRMIETLTKARPKVRFSLELITRDALKVPVLTDDYWRTFPDLPATDLARTLRTVRTHGTGPFPEIESQPLAALVGEESRNVRESLDYAATELRL